MIAVNVDELGRIQLPQSVQDQLKLAISTSLNLEVQDGQIILTPIMEELKVYYENDLLVVEAAKADNLDIINALREERIQEQIPW